MLDDKEERIKAEAYRRWEQEGRPHGQHDRHWHEAADAVETGKPSDLIESEGTTQAVKTPKSRAAKPKDTKAVDVVAAPAPKAKKAAVAAKAEVEAPKKAAAAMKVEVEAPKKVAKADAPKKAAKAETPKKVEAEEPKRSRAKKVAAE